jgi:hypothetical protein
MPDLTGFDANEHEPVSFEPIPKGDYVAIATSSEWKETQNKKGQRLVFEWQVVEGEHKNRKVFDGLNLKNDNETTVKIANGTLSSICRAVGVMRPRDSSELHNKPAIIKVVVTERNDKPGVFRNEIKGYASTSEAGKSAGGGAPAPGNGGQGKPPWAK